jgi:hypothetical protein
MSPGTIPSLQKLVRSWLQLMKEHLEILTKKKSK